MLGCSEGVRGPQWPSALLLVRGGQWRGQALLTRLPGSILAQLHWLFYKFTRMLIGVVLVPPLVSLYRVNTYSILKLEALLTLISTTQEAQSCSENSTMQPGAGEEGFLPRTLPDTRARAHPPAALMHTRAALAEETVLFSSSGKAGR